jgi:hypothetical protein
VGPISHPLFTYSFSVRSRDESIHVERAKRHGWGTVALESSPLNPAPAPLDSTQMRKSANKGRLFDVLAQVQDLSAQDIWIGHPKINPAKGKGHAKPFHDPKHIDIAVVLSGSMPGLPGDDAWLGNITVKPGIVVSGSGPYKGSESNQLRDAWVGNLLIKDGSGKKAVHQGIEEQMLGATFRDISSAPEVPRGRKPKATSAPSEEAVPKVGKKILPVPRGEVKVAPDIYATMTFAPLREEEKQVFSQFPHDGKSWKPKRQIKGGTDPRRGGKEMLTYSPNIRVGSFVPLPGGLFQEGVKSTRVGLPPSSPFFSKSGILGTS